MGFGGSLSLISAGKDIVMGHKRRRRKKHHKCGHKGFGTYCHRCAEEGKSLDGFKSASALRAQRRISGSRRSLASYLGLDW